jgi:sphingomyelin phosphodiesterase acid-like 3
MTSSIRFAALTAHAVLLLGLLSVMTLPARASSQPKESKFLLVSDFHFNPMADPSLVKDLEAAEPAQWEPILERTVPATFSQYKSDTNWWLLKSALRQFPATLPHPAFVMVTGDLLAHRFRETFQKVTGQKITDDRGQERYRAFVLKTVQFLGLKLQHEFPGTKIYITPGNNDNDCGDYTITPNGPFLRDTAPLFLELAGGDPEFANSWKSLGSFDVPHPTLPGVRIISINSNFFSQLYDPRNSSQGCTPISSNAGTELMAWLDQRLATDTTANQKVWLMFHIPPGIDGYATASKRKSLVGGGAVDNTETCRNSIQPMWVPQWTTQFDALLEKYSSTVVAGFAAHIHSDDFRLIGPAGAGRQFVILNPAISPIYGQNPGFRVVSYDGNGTVTDQTTYYLTNLPKASRTSKGRWKREYTFTRKWKKPRLDAASLGGIYNSVVANDKVRENWLKLYAVQGPTAQDEKNIVQALYCADEGLTKETYSDCYCGMTKR